jgi:hypothetical protein
VCESEREREREKEREREREGGVSATHYPLPSLLYYSTTHAPAHVGLRPEHTLEAYSLAYDEGTDYVECDALMTRDGVLICRHFLALSSTTYV